MESMDNIRERFEALEQQTEQLKHETQALKAHTYMVERRLRWWQGIACGVMLLGLVSMPLQSGTAADTQPGAMAERMSTLENKLSAMTFDGAANEVVISGANLRIVNGLGSTETTNGLGNLIVGYNELRMFGAQNIRTGSHNAVVGKQHNFASFGGLVVGSQSDITGQWASVSGGSRNTASGDFSSVSGGQDNQATGAFSVVSGGQDNITGGAFSVVSGGHANVASGELATISAGASNTAHGVVSSVSGGANRPGGSEG
jgi:hypothetical protein